ncbi:MAG: biotin/lipoyl-binding protein [Bacteroidia bacterium]
MRNIVPGFVTDIRFTDNAQVKKGDTLLRINDADYRAHASHSPRPPQRQARRGLRSGANVAAPA